MKTWCQAFAFKINLYRYTSGFAQERHATENKRPVMFCKVHSGDRWKEGRRVAAGHKPESAAAPAPGPAGASGAGSGGGESGGAHAKKDTAAAGGDSGAVGENGVGARGGKTGAHGAAAHSAGGGDGEAVTTGNGAAAAAAVENGHGNGNGHANGAGELRHGAGEAAAAAGGEYVGGGSGGGGGGGGGGGDIAGPQARAALVACLWDGFSPFLQSTRDHSRLGKLSRRLLAASGLANKDCGRLAALEAVGGEAEAKREVGLYKSNPVDPSRLKAPGFNP
jgi:hypothetical protein